MGTPGWSSRAAETVLLLTTLWSLSGCGLLVMDIVEELEISKVSAESGKLQRFLGSSGEADSTADTTSPNEPIGQFKYMDPKSLGPVKEVHLRLSRLFIVTDHHYAAVAGSGPATALADDLAGDSTVTDSLAKAGLSEEDLLAALGGSDASWLDILGNAFGLPAPTNVVDNTGCPDNHNFNFMVRTEIFISPSSPSPNLPPVRLGLLDNRQRCAVELDIQVDSSINLAAYYERGMILNTQATTLPVPEDVYFSGTMMYRVVLW